VESFWHVLHHGKIPESREESLLKLEIGRDLQHFLQTGFGVSRHGSHERFLEPKAISAPHWHSLGLRFLRYWARRAAGIRDGGVRFFAATYNTLFGHSIFIMLDD
jgi:hypothetical protein